MYTGRKCFLCGRNGCGDPLDRHHIFGEANRRKSDKLGLVVDLCHDRCHENGREAVHNNADTMEQLHKYGQKKAMREQGWTVEEFIMEFGKNYLSAEELEEFYLEDNEEYNESTFFITDDEVLPY